MIDLSGLVGLRWKYIYFVGFRHTDGFYHVLMLSHYLGLFYFNDKSRLKTIESESS